MKHATPFSVTIGESWEEMGIEVHQAITRVPWRLRLRYWWMMRRLSPAGRALVREVAREEERRFLGL